MEESSLQEALDEYNQQLLQIQSVLNSDGVEDQSQQELLKLRDDLIELVQVTEESLLSLKKSKLLQILDDQSRDLIEDAEIQEELSFEQEEESSNGKEDGVEEDDIVGTKCRVLHCHDWGSSEQHNGIILSVESVPENGSLEETEVRVLFTNPTHKSMLPCPYFLDGKCTFEESNCRYSHGYAVKVADLKPFKEPDFSKVDVGQSCLAKYNDGIWYKAAIRSIDHSKHTFVVHYETYNSDATLELDSILPLDDATCGNISDDEDDADQSSITSMSESNIIANGTMNEDHESVRGAWKPMDSPLGLGDWEQHTKGIGSKLLAKMGYIMGKGLGKEGKGRIEPVEIVVLPPGKSLDRIAELREQKKLVEPFKTKKKKKSKQKTCNAVTSKESKRDNFFGFINAKLGGMKGNLRNIHRVPQAGTSAENFALSDKTKDSKKKNDKDVNWNLQLFKIHEDISKAKKHLQRQEDALSRNLGRDSAVAVQIEQKIKDTRTHLSHLHTKEKMVQQKLHHKKQHKKLTVF